MRRKDREVTDLNVINEIIGGVDHFRIGFYDAGKVYIVPLHFGTEVLADGKRVFYAHGALEGRKIDLARQGGSVGFELDRNYALLEASTACAHSARFQSVIGNGIVSLVEELEEKEHALSLIMKQATGKDWTFPEGAIRQVAVIKVEVTNLSCKEHGGK